MIDVLLAEFQESIQSAIPQKNALFSDSDKKIQWASPHILAKTSGEGKNIHSLV